jgi:hypothetical protein
MIQRVLTEPDWTQRMLPDDLRALTPLIYAHVTPYGDFSARHEPEVGDRTRCRCCLTATSTLPLVTRMFLLGLLVKRAPLWTLRSYPGRAVRRRAAH